VGGQIPPSFRGRPTPRCRRASLDDLVGLHKQFQRNSQAEGIGGLAVDREEEARRLLDRLVAGFCALDVVYVKGRAPVEVSTGNRSGRPCRAAGQSSKGKIP
jgi:hypothetical protein